MGAKLSKDYLSKDHLSDREYEFADATGNAEYRYSSPLRGVRKRESLSTELYELNETDLKDKLIKFLQSRRESTIRSYIKTFERYFSWIEENKYYEFKYDYNKVLEEIRSYCISNTTAVDFSRSEIYEYINSMDNIIDAMILSLIFEGIVGGKKYSDILTLKKDSLKGTKLYLKNNEYRELPSEAIQLYHKTAAQNKVRVKGKEKPLYENEYLIRNRQPRGIVDRDNGSTYIRNKLNRTRNKQFVYKGISINGPNLIRAGRLFCLSLVDQIQGGLEKEDYYAILKMYEVDSASRTKYQDLKDDYEEYKESECYEEINVIEYDNIYKQIKCESKDYSEHQSKADIKLGNRGEEDFYDLLIQRYGKQNVFDETKNGVGYDFSVFTKDYSKQIFEVKSTRKQEDNKLGFYLTMNELRQAYDNRNRHYLIIMYYDNLDKLKSMYQIPYFIDNLNLSKQAKLLLELKRERICVPISMKVDIDFNLIKPYKIKVLS